MKNEPGGQSGEEKLQSCFEEEYMATKKRKEATDRIFRGDHEGWQEGQETLAQVIKPGEKEEDPERDSAAEDLRQSLMARLERRKSAAAMFDEDAKLREKKREALKKWINGQC